MGVKQCPCYNAAMFHQLQVSHFRNIHQLSAKLSPGFNLIYGQNGSGKTSLLEALYLLVHGRSFRTHLLNRVIQYQQPELVVFARLQSGQQQIPIGFSRHQDGSKQIRVAGEEQQSIIHVTKLAPLLLLDPDCQRLLTEGPKPRRAFLDWGVFHVEHGFYQHWQRLNRALKQRNAALSQQLSQAHIRMWDEEIISVSTAIDQQRANYISEFKRIFLTILPELLPKVELTLRYYRGWAAERELADVLLSNYEKDLRLGYTQFAAHRADLRLTIDGVPAPDALSQGQQKLLVYALKLAQGKLLREQLNQPCLFLLDDLTAELDEENQQRVATILASLHSQVFITGLNQGSLAAIAHLSDQTNMFHVEQGAIIA